MPRKPSPPALKAVEPVATPDDGVTVPPAPADLGAAGRELWQKFTTDLVPDERELLVIGMAARQADRNAALDAQVEHDGLMVAGSVGQQRLHPAIAEARQGRVAVARMLAVLAVPGAEDEKPMTAAQVRASRAARSRWGVADA